MLGVALIVLQTFTMYGWLFAAGNRYALCAFALFFTRSMSCHVRLGLGIPSRYSSSCVVPCAWSFPDSRV